MLDPSFTFCPSAGPLRPGPGDESRNGPVRGNFPQNASGLVEVFTRQGPEVSGFGFPRPGIEDRRAGLPLRLLTNSVPADRSALLR